MAFATPSHQFPTGAILPLARRLELLEWARRANAVLVEDDYDGEFRYEGQPLESLQGLDREGRVIYIGTFSRTVFSSLRIGYLVVRRAWGARSRRRSGSATGTPRRSSRKRWLNSSRAECMSATCGASGAGMLFAAALVDSIRKYLDDRVEVTGDGAGAHVVLWPARALAEETIIAAAAARGVGVYGTSPYFLKRPSRTGIMLGYSRLRETEIREGIRRLSEVL